MQSSNFKFTYWDTYCIFHTTTDNSVLRHVQYPIFNSHTVRATYVLRYVQYLNFMLMYFIDHSCLLTPPVYTTYITYCPKYLCRMIHTLYEFPPHILYRLIMFYDTYSMRCHIYILARNLCFTTRSVYEFHVLILGFKTCSVYCFHIHILSSDYVSSFLYYILARLPFEFNTVLLLARSFFCWVSVVSVNGLLLSPRSPWTFEAILLWLSKIFWRLNSIWISHSHTVRTVPNSTTYSIRLSPSHTVQNCCCLAKLPCATFDLRS